MIHVQIDWNPVNELGSGAVTFLKHATVMIKDRDEYFLVDPILYDLSSFFKTFHPYLSM